MLSIGNKSL